ncbi:peptidoglycan editing factor PgeF [Dyella solisilvae]|uniref:Purine nucleoside phosphorylase n=1 Tax=Dyella solisilvae TaxID=1920168 RepID=A0A370KE33_9GAMM|nr:peptidoglycan editing factor PgeF [Dyella solisilvae]RDJ00351.1 peptidoglycan editing factor PgeF [Dyella solisilvae]
MPEGWIKPEWPVPPGVRCAVSTRQAPGVSERPHDRFNLGLRCGDAPAAVEANRAAVSGALGLQRSPHWLQQVHGVDVADIDRLEDDGEPRADAAVTTRVGEPLAILTADCLPVLFCTRDGTAVAAAHAGWRGLAAGVLEATLAALPAPPSQVMAWLGPCIGAPSYEVGKEAHEAFLATDAGAAACFTPTRPGHWLCDLAGLARRRLQAAGVTTVHGGGFDTRTDARFYSYRRDGAHSGRFASLIWLVP